MDFSFFDVVRLNRNVRQAIPFIVGCGRSGTTLLQAIFDSHPEMAMGFKSDFLLALAKRRNEFETSAGFRSDLLVEDLLARKGFLRWNIPEQALRVVFAGDPPVDLPDAMRRVYGLYAALRGKSRYGDKTNNYAYHLPLIAGMFPEARFIHLIRDGRNVALSYMEIEWGPSSWEGAARRWRERVDAARRGGRELGTERYCEIKYEELVDNPERSLRSLCGFVQLEYHPAMLQYQERAGSISEAQSYPHRHRNISRPPTRGLRDWRTQMPPDALKEFEAIAGDLLTQLGYEQGQQ